MMNALVVKVLAVGLTLSQLFTQSPEKFKESFDPIADQAEVAKLLSAGCVYVNKQFEIENINFEAIFAMLNGQGGVKSDILGEKQPTEKSYVDKLIDDLDPTTMYAAYRQFCKDETVENSPVKLDEVIKYYNSAIGILPDPATLKNKKLPEASVILDLEGKKFTEVYSDNNRRKWVKITDLPPYAKQAFVAAEDQHFYKHQGVDIRGLIRAFSNNATGISGNRPQGGSTITQQVVKNLLVGDDLTFERKIREMIVAVRLESVLSKDEILELYLNYVFLGRASWGDSPIVGAAGFQEPVEFGAIKPKASSEFAVRNLPPVNQLPKRP